MTAVDEITIPDSPEALQEFMSNGPQMEKILAAGKMGDVANAYAKAISKRDTSIDNQVRDGVEKGLADFIAESRGAGAKPPVDLTPAKARNFGLGIGRAKGAMYNAHAPAAKLDEVFANAGEFFQAIAGRGGSRRNELAATLAKYSDIQNAFGSTVPADGGFLIPEVLRSEILRVALETAVIRPRATVIPMESLRVPIPMVDSTTNAGSIFGGIQAYWTEEAQALTVTSANFGRVVLDAKKLTAYADVPNELLADAPAFMAFFDQLFPMAIAWFEDIAFNLGSGVGEPLGWMNATPILIKVDPDTSSKISWNDVSNMYSRMLPSSLGSAVWLCAPDAFPQLTQMTFGTGQFPALVSIGGGSNAFQLSLLGRPVIITEKTAPLGTDGALSFVDLSYYLIGDRQQMQTAQSTDYQFKNDETSFRIIERLDGRPWIQSPITPANGSSNTLSPFVELAGTHT